MRPPNCGTNGRYVLRQELSHHGHVKVIARGTDGSWDRWRVGRRRLAFIPGIPEWMLVLMDADGFIGGVGAVATATSGCPTSAWIISTRKLSADELAILT